ncbi:MAG TPA: glycosyltransferase, partial [Polyangiaceae bacterium]|nr:glycosyltransferase [Polyangiaceae bacterium]
MQLLLLAAYCSVLIVLCTYGAHRALLVYQCWLHRRRIQVGERRVDIAEDALPTVTVQLPIFNEATVAARLIEATGKLDYPTHKLEIQVLDDSTDETVRIARDAVAALVARGIDAQHVRRPNRLGYKAGALDYGLDTAKGELVAIFDADFVPQADFLRQVVGHFQDARIGMVQTRWGHMNRDHSLFTQVQALMLDGHHMVENRARFGAGHMFNFSGTGGIWRRAAIEAAGGWQHDTLTEDLDLSYRAQLRGWRFVFVSDLIAPAEVPVEMNAFKSQQHRWAKGSIQTCRKLLPLILRANVPLGVKAEAFFHLTANFNYILMCLLSILMFPSMVIRYNMGWYEMLLIDIPLFFAATFSFCNFYTVCQREIHKDWLARLKYVPFLMSVGIGLSINNTRAVLEALFNAQSDFARTP